MSGEQAIPWLALLVHGRALHDRSLLGLACRVAYRTLRDFMRATLREPEAVPGVVASIQTFGTLANWHPHLHLLVTDGAFRPDGTFLHLGFHQIEILTEAFRRAVLRAWVRRELLDPDAAQSRLAWEHSGFHVHHSVRLEADDALGMLQLARYAARAPVALDRLHYDVGKKRVRLVSDKPEGPTAGTHDYDPLEFLALLLAHVPDRFEILVRYAGAYSVRRRARWRKLGILGASRLQALPPDPNRDAIPPWPALRALRRRWAELLRRIFEVDPLRCRRCGAAMGIVAFVLDPEVTTAILRHLRRHGRDPYAMLDELLVAEGRAPP